MSVVRFEPTSQEQRQLTMNGLPGYLYAERRVALDRVSRYTSTTEGLKPLPVTVDEQIGDLNKVLEDPLHSPYVFCIGSEPNDLVAKTLAGAVMLEVLRMRRKSLWHNIIGGYKDDLRDRPFLHKKNELMVFSNVTANSTEQKFEKLRDLLETYSDHPRIVTMTGMEPVSFFNYIGYPLHYSIWLRSERTNRVLGN